ncbi:MAG: hypothetical protein RL077_2731 [Verrucomicrobiota bacterium]|jgi:hypothetical protein
MKTANTTPNMITPDQLDRRTVLKRIALGAGGVVLQPFLNALAAEARGEAPPPRIVFVIESNGLYDYHVRPEKLGKPGLYDGSPQDRLVDAPLAGHALPNAISPLEAVKDRMSIVLGLSCAQVRPNHGAGYGALGCYWSGRDANSTANDPLFQTVDHALASPLPGIIPVFGLGVHGDAQTVFANTVSVSSPKRPLPMICQPEVAFQTLFGSVAEGDARKAFNVRNKLLDWTRADIRRVSRELSGTDREKLDVYLDTFEQMQTRQDKINAIQGNLQAHRPAIDKFNSKRMTDRFEAQVALAVAALASRLTNVVVLDASCGPHGYKTWTELGITKDGHAIGHSINTPESAEFAAKIRRFHAERIADLARRMSAIKEGNGTLLDNTLIVYLSDSAEEHHGRGMQWPMVLVGNLGGRLKTAGRFLQYPGYKKAGHRTMSNFFLSLLHAVGDKREKFGEPDHELRDIDTAGPLAEILV